MNDFKSVQDLIVKAAIYNGISTTISPSEISGDILKVTFSKDGRHSSTCIELYHRFIDPEVGSLCACKDALHRLIWEPYEEIKCVKENTK